MDKQKQLECFVELLERREMLAGSVEGVVRGTTLRLTGDDLANSITMDVVGGQLQVTGNATAVTIDGDLSRVQKVIYKSGDGADATQLLNLDLGGAIVIIGEGGQDVSVVGSTAKGLSIKAGAGPVNLSLSDSHVIGRVAVTSRGAVDSAIEFGSNTIVDRGSVVNLGGSGTRSLTIDGAQLDGGLIYKSSGGNLTTTVMNDAFIGRKLTTSVTAGNDDFTMTDTSTIEGVLARKTVDGNSSTIVQDQATVTRLVSAQTVGGASDVQLIDESVVGLFKGSGVTKQSNVTYATRASGDLKADIYTPKTDGPHPAILAIHGGGWRAGTKSGMSARAKVLADRGYVVVNVDYRLAPDVRLEDIIHDVKSAVAWMRDNATELNIDPNRIGTYGYSAGAHLALMLGVTDGSEGLEGPDANGTSTRVQAVVAGGPGGTDFTDIGANDDRFEYLFGGTRAELPTDYANASPTTWVSADDPPVFMFMGTNDTLIDQDKARTFQQTLDAAGVENELLEIPGGNHLSVRTNRLAMIRSLRFLDSQLK